MISLLETPDENQRRRARAFGSLCVFLVVVLLAVNATAGEGSLVSEGPNVGVGLGLTLLFAALAAMVALGMPLFVIIGVLVNNSSDDSSTSTTGAPATTEAPATTVAP